MGGIAISLESISDKRATVNLIDSRAVLRTEIGFPFGHCVLAPPKVLIWDPCPVSLPDILIIAGMYMYTCIHAVFGTVFHMHVNLRRHADVVRGHGKRVRAVASTICEGLLTKLCYKDPQEG